MGSLTSGPKPRPAQSQVVFVPQAVSAPTPTTPSTPSTNDTNEPQETAEEANTRIRTQNLLNRERSRFGTIQTSFRGLLDTAAKNNQPPRKTLLGE
ncbi:MAG: hypothetical protein AB8B83_07225 [Bdellovibrionales bacterium]